MSQRDADRELRHALDLLRARRAEDERRVAEANAAVHVAIADSLRAVARFAGADALPEAWRLRAEQLDEYARRMRRAGDPREAEDAEAAATDYRIAADERETRVCPR
jgi:hypothetical protein